MICWEKLFEYDRKYKGSEDKQQFKTFGQNSEITNI